MRFVLVDWLKFVAVLLIIVDHSLEKVTGFMWELWIVGAVGVGLFVFTSGFLNKPVGAGFKDFKVYLQKKVLKLLPLFLLASLLMFGFRDSVSLNALVGNLFFVGCLFWFVPLILGFYLLNGLRLIDARLFKVGVGCYVGGCLVKAGLSIFLFDWNGLIMGLYWLCLLALFLFGVQVKSVPDLLPRNVFVEKISGFSYPIYLFQSVFIDSVLHVGVYVGLLYVGLAVGLLVLDWVKQ